MPYHEKGDVARATRAVRTACDDVQAFRANRHLQIPSLLSHLVEALNQLSAELNVLTDSAEALSIFGAYNFKEENNHVLSDAIVHDMEATATYFRTMTSEGLAELPATLSEQEYRKVKEMVDQYVKIVSTISGEPKECVRIKLNRCSCFWLIRPRSSSSSRTAQGRELQEGIDVIRRRQAEQQESELAEMRTSELLSVPLNVALALTPSKKRSMTG
jgi:hypothetical protein